MTVVCVGNFKSGRGLSRRLLRRFSDALSARGHRVLELELTRQESEGSTRFDSDRFKGARAILAIGGDGTVNAVTDVAIRTGTPVYHVPAGNENLVARRFGMSRDPITFLRALDDHRVIHADVGLAGSGESARRFLIMATVGPDARVIERLHYNRTKALGHLAYVEPVIREAVSPYLPSLTVTVDGNRVVNDRPGWLIIANDREYASRLNFAVDAGPLTRSLTAVFLPATNLRDCINWTLRAWTRRHTRDPRMITAEGTAIRVESVAEGPNAGLIFQLDGEHDPHIAERLEPNGLARSAIDLSLDRERLPILVPDPAKV